MSKLSNYLSLLRFSQWSKVVCVMLVFYLFVLQVRAIWSFTIDDMFISLRYAKHWASGYGLLWNPDSPPVEGYSNFSFVALAALALSFNGNPVITLKIAGLIGLGVTCFFVYLISRFWFEKQLSLIPCFFLLLYKGQIIWAVSGLETTMYEGLICASVYFIFYGMGYCFFPDSQINPRPLFLMLAGLILAFSGMTRPEAPCLIILFVLIMCCDKPSTPIKDHWKGILYFSGASLSIYLPYFLWRWHYYGYLFPNSIYCKGFVTHSFNLDVNYLKLIWPFALFAIPACFKSADKRHYFLWLPSVVYLLILMNSDDVVAFDNRLFLPAFVLLVPLTVQGLSILLLGYLNLKNAVESTMSGYCTDSLNDFDDFLLHRMGDTVSEKNHQNRLKNQHINHSRDDSTAFFRLKKRDELFFGALCLISFCFALFFIPRMTLFEYNYFSQGPIRGEQLRKQVGDWLSTYASISDTVVLADSGMIPYYSHLKFIDSYCLNNRSMAHYPIADRYQQFCHHIFEEQPKVIILTSLIEHNKVNYTPADTCLKSSLIAHSEYKLASVFSTRGHDSTYRYELFSNF